MHVAEMRRFDRFYTRLIGVLDEGHLASPYSLAQVRVLYELASQGASTAGELCARLDLDPGYSSRLLVELEQRRLITRQRSTEDRRQVRLALTAKGKRTTAELDRKASAAVEQLLAPLAPARRTDVIEAMRRIRGAFEPAPAAYVLRDPRPGDLGWVVHRHGALYSEEYGWGPTFEALVARIVADYAAHHDPERERCWIAERDGAIAGSVFVVQKSRTVAQLRLLYVEPSARGLGIGARLVHECTRFARQARYRKLVLWTQSPLVSARKLYEAEGYKLAGEEPSEYGTSQTWELAL